MTLRPEYSLGHSPYNAFLFAAIGEEQVGGPLTVLSALTRLGFDPWQEAARLAGLPRETAARVFAVTIAMLPEGDWKASESEAIAARLVNWLPGQVPQAIPLLQGEYVEQENEVKNCDSAGLGRACRRPALFYPASLQQQQLRIWPRGRRVDTWLEGRLSLVPSNVEI